MTAAKSLGLLDALGGRWAALASRERALVGSAIMLVLAAVLWWIGIAPALTQLRQAREAAPALDAQLQLMRAQAAQATTLRAQRSLSYDESLRSLENSVKSLGAGGVLNVSDARASITLRGVSGDALAQMLAQVRSNARLVPSEVRIKQAAGIAPNPAVVSGNGAPVGTATGTSTALGTAAAPVATAWDGTVVLSLPSR